MLLCSAAVFAPRSTFPIVGRASATSGIANAAIKADTNMRLRFIEAPFIRRVLSLGGAESAALVARLTTITPKRRFSATVPELRGKRLIAQ
jgi:hypothetical protein